MVNLEKKLEKAFVKWCRERDIEPIKGPTATSKGFPDRFLQLPNGGGTIYVEFKGSSSYSLTPLQEWWSTYLKDSNVNRYFLVESETDLEALKKTCLNLIKIGPGVIAYEKQVLSKLID